MRGILFWGAHAPPRVADDALVIAILSVQGRFGEGAESPSRTSIGTRGACAPQQCALRSPQFATRNLR